MSSHGTTGQGCVCLLAALGRGNLLPAGFLFGRVWKGVLQGVPAPASTLLSQVPSPKGACCSRPWSRGN